MKSRSIILASALLISVGSFAQKDQIKAAEKALKSGNALEAINQLKQAEPLLASASETEKAQYNFVKGNASKDMADKKMEVGKNYTAAAKAYQEVLTIEKASGKSKYTEEAQVALTDVKKSLLGVAQAEIDKGTASNDPKNFKSAADLLYQTYELDKTSLDNLYYASVYYLKGEAYDEALKNFLELKKQNFSGEATNYYAKNAVSEKEEFYGATPAAKTNRDNQVRLKLASAPRDEKVPSKKSEITRYIALIYAQQGKNKEALDAIAEALALSLDDDDLLTAQSGIYLKMGDMENYKKVTSKLVAKKPNDPDLFFNLVVASAAADPVAAEGYYKKAIAIKPDYYGAYINLAVLTIRDEKKLIDDMNKLGTSEKDNKRYEVLKKQKDVMYQTAYPYLEKAYELKPDDNVGEMLISIYGALEMTDKKKALKAKMGN